MFSNLNFRTIRALQICIVFTLSIFIERQLHIPRGGWTGFTVIMIYAGFDMGASVQRTMHRTLGVLTGLLFSLIVWFFGHLDFRIIYLVIPALIFFNAYSLGKTYAYTTIFTTALSVVGSDYFGSTTVKVEWYFVDYMMCTLLAAAICIFFEYFVFIHVNMTRKFYIDLQEDIICQLVNLISLTEHNCIKKSLLFNETVILNKKLSELYSFTKNTEHDYHNKDDLISELEEFSQSVHEIYQNFRKLLLIPSQKRPLLLTDTNSLIEKLKLLVNREKAECNV